MVTERGSSWSLEKVKITFSLNHSVLQGFCAHSPQCKSNIITFKIIVLCKCFPPKNTPFTPEWFILSKYSYWSHFAEKSCIFSYLILCSPTPWCHCQRITTYLLLWISIMADIGRCDCVIVHVVEPCVCLVQWSGEQNYRNRSWLARLVLFWIGAKSLNSSTPRRSKFLSWMRLMSWLQHRVIKTRAFASRGMWFPS